MVLLELLATKTGDFVSARLHLLQILIFGVKLRFLQITVLQNDSSYAVCATVMVCSWL